MAKRTGVYRSEKRKKEMTRQKKQEEKRLRRFSKDVSTKKDSEFIESEDKKEQN